MSIPNRQIGWSQESNLLSYISKQLERLTGVTFNSLSALAPTYKVYTALVTQSGGDDPQSWASGSGPLILGVTYQIGDNDGGTADFTNVGAPNNNVGTYFVATGTTPNSWGIGDNGYLSANGGAPVVTVLENTIGNVWWEYITIGTYNINATGAFNDQKTFVNIQNPNSAYTNTSGTCSSSVSTNFVQIITYDNVFIPSNDQLYLNSIEIRVYN